MAGRRIAVGFILAAATLGGAAVGPADAASLRVKLACSRDYYAFCSQYPSGGPEVRQCMRRVGEKLSPRCVQALIADGEVTQAEVSQRAAAKKIRRAQLSRQ